MYSFTTEQNTFLGSSGRVILHACPGSGKTTVVAQKVINYIKNWNRPHQGIAVLSFTNVASDEIERQARDILPEGYTIDAPHFIGTLDSFIDNFIFLRFGYLLLPSPKRPIIATPDIAFSYKYWKKECYQTGCVSNVNQFRWIAEGGLSKNGELITCPGTSKFGPPCYQFKKTLLNKGLFFQEEIPSLACLLLKKHPEVAKSIAARFPVIILDEAQDTSTEQMEVMDLLCEAGVESMYIVGDPDQSIYEWRTADPESFLRKMKDERWTHLALSKNFRSSQLICNATYVFSEVLKDRAATEALGKTAQHPQKPIVILYGKKAGIDNVIAKFKELCADNGIELSPQTVALVTRAKIHADCEVRELWKTEETELLAKASYEWAYGKRKRAYELCEKAIFQLVVKPFSEIVISIEDDASKKYSYEFWKTLITDILVALPSADEACGMWVSNAKTAVQNIIQRYNVLLVNGITLSDAIKIKSRDTKKPNFKEIPVKMFFEKKTQNEFTYASVHGVKGETFEALMLLIQGTKGNTLTPSFLASGDTSKELMRIAYVAMTRPRKLLVVAMPKSTVDLSGRFPADKWEYIELV